MSLPVRGAWIEIAMSDADLLQLRTSLPVRGAWIEIRIGVQVRLPDGVAPRAGSVD